MSVKPSREGAYVVRSIDGASKRVSAQSPRRASATPTAADRALARAVLRAKAGERGRGCLSAEQAAAVLARGGDQWSNPTVVLVCPDCGWSVLGENASGPDQPCEAWLLGDDIAACDSPLVEINLTDMAEQSAREEGRHGR